jgi:hypothetical protein
MNAFEAPDEEREPESWGWVAVLVAWALAGATLGTAIGATLQVLGFVGNGAPIGLGTALFSGLLGGGALILERSRSEGRPELVDTRGLRSRPLHGVLLAVPVAVSLRRWAGSWWWCRWVGRRGSRRWCSRCWRWA